MKPNGKSFSVCVLFVALCAVTLHSALGQAETLRGSFKLPVEARWGKVLLEPGDYEFTMTNNTSGRIVTVRSKETGLAGMILSSTVSDLHSEKETKLMLEKCETGVYVRALYLGDSGVVLTYETPKSGKLTRLMQPPSTTMASAAGGH